MLAGCRYYFSQPLTFSFVILFSRGTYHRNFSFDPSSLFAPYFTLYMLKIRRIEAGCSKSHCIHVHIHSLRVSGIQALRSWDYMGFSVFWPIMVAYKTLLSFLFASLFPEWRFFAFLCLHGIFSIWPIMCLDLGEVFLKPCRSSFCHSFGNVCIFG